MIYLKEETIHEVVISKSRFITVLTPVNSQALFPDILSSIKKRFPKATHYCTAYIIGENGEIQGSNDDGEPSGTAGIPMLEILRNKQVTDVYAVVIRYFGGIKLGAGGLIRAYAGSVKQTLEVSEYYKKIKAPSFRVHFNYHLISKMDQLFSNFIVINKTYGTDIIYEICIPDGNTESLLAHKHLFLNFEILDEEILIIPWP